MGIIDKFLPPNYIISQQVGNLKTNYIIKHDDVDVCIISFNIDFRIEKVVQVLNDEHLPPYILSSKEKNIYKYDEWFGGRTVSPNREGIQEILKKYNARNARELLLKNYALSLYDHYWVCPENENIKWKEINFFENKFKEEAGNILLGNGSSKGANELTPESSSGGNLPKKWEWKNGGTYLIKKGSGQYQQEPFNEAIVSKIMKMLGISGVEYFCELKKGVPQCRCKNMLSGNDELIHAWDIVHEMKLKEDKYDSFIKLVKNKGIKNIGIDIDKMLVLDFIIANTDRHFNNIGFLRDVQTLKYKCLAPIYDSGNSLWYDKNAEEIIGTRNIPCKPFKSYHHEQIKKVKHFDWFNRKALSGIDSVIYEGLAENQKIPQSKKDAIVKKVNLRINALEKMKQKTG